MKNAAARLLLVLAVLLGLPSGAFTQAQTAQRPANEELAALAGADWLTSGGSLSNARYSTLAQITAANVANVKGVWLARLGSAKGAQYRLEAEPLVLDGTMYLSNGVDDVFALDARTGRRLWQFSSGLDAQSGTPCCGWTSRGVAVGGGLVFAGLLDGSFVALDQQTGAVVWWRELESWQRGYSIASAPRYYDGMVFTGIQGSDYGVRGRVYALDAQSGSEIWRFYTVPAPGELGADTWPPGDAYLHGGADVWQTPAIDPDLGMIYFSTGNAAPNYDGSVRAGDNLFTASIVALDYRTGQYRWHFQEVHHDIWNYGAPSPVVLVDTRIDGQLRKSVYQCGKTGWCYLLDRSSGQPLTSIQERAVPQEPRQVTSSTQPYPSGPAFVPQCGEAVVGFASGCLFDPFWDSTVTIRPGAAGGAPWAPTAYDPSSGYVYVHGVARNSAYVARPQAFTSGQRYQSGAPDGPLGSTIGWTLTAIDSVANRIIWQADGLGDAGYGALATAGGLVFAGQVDGQLVAYDARTGKPLWQFQAGWGITAPPVTWSLDGVQYVSVMAGGNSESGPPARDGDAIWTFALTGNIDEPPAPPPPQSKVGIPVQVEMPPPFEPVSSA
jgi:quinohemoprotein ethanol dehydrogenase